MASSTMAAASRAALSGAVAAAPGSAQASKGARHNAAATPRCKASSTPKALAVEGLRTNAQTGSLRSFSGVADLRKGLNVAHVQKANAPRRGIMAAAAADDGCK